MHILKISATASTNSYIKSLLKENPSQKDLVVVAEEQTGGRGQMGTVWHSQPTKSLTFSVYKLFSNFEVSNQFYLSMAVSLAIKETLEQFKIPEIKIKWPNDILSANKKICGILIENILKKNAIHGSIIGIGLNVNETEFDSLPDAISMRMASNTKFDRDFVLESLIKNLSEKLVLLQNNFFSQIEDAYLKSLYRINCISVFENSEQQKFNGIIQGVSPEGKLLVKTEDEVVTSFGLKEIKRISGLK